MDVTSIMTREPLTIPPTLPVDEALDRMMDNDIRHFPVVSEGRLVGVISDRDLLALVPDALHRGGGSSEAGVVGDIMVHNPTTITPQDTVVTAAVELLVHRIGCLPVMEKNVVVGMVSEMDMLVAYERMCEGGAGDGSLDDPLLADLMHKDPLVVDANTSVEEATRIMTEKKVRHLPVLEGGRLLGMLSDRDLRRARAPGHDESKVGSLVDTAVSLPPEERASRAAHLMALAKVSALPILSEKGMVGLLSITDMLEHALSSLRDTVER